MMQQPDSALDFHEDSKPAQSSKQIQQNTCSDVDMEVKILPTKGNYQWFKSVGYSTF